MNKSKSKKTSYAEEVDAKTQSKISDLESSGKDLTVMEQAMMTAGVYKYYDDLRKSGKKGSDQAVKKDTPGPKS